MGETKAFNQPSRTVLKIAMLVGFAALQRRRGQACSWRVSTGTCLR